jgi:poly(beta-D-mannuronate) lyase
MPDQRRHSRFRAGSGWRCLPHLLALMPLLLVAGAAAPATAAGDAIATMEPIPVADLAPSQFVVTRPGTVLVDRSTRQAVLATLPADMRTWLCGEGRSRWPRHGVQRNISGDSQVAQTLAYTLMQAGARYLAEADPRARGAIVNNLRRLAHNDAFSRLVEPVTVNHFYNLDRTLLPIIVNFALISDDPAVDPERVAEIWVWLDRLVRWRGPERQTDPTRPSSRNNHRYLRDSVTMAWGAMVGDNALFFTGIDRFRIALEQTRDDGSLPLETDRGAQALFYQRHAISSLVAIAEIAAAQGYDLYAMQSRDGSTLHDMIRFLVDAIDDPEVIERYTDEPQYLGFLDWRGHDRHYMAWFEAYRARFPESPLTRRLEAQIRTFGTLDEPLLDEYVGAATSCFFADPATIDRAALDPAALD